jgi:hypothetical protein
MTTGVGTRVALFIPKHVLGEAPWCSDQPDHWVYYQWRLAFYVAMGWVLSPIYSLPVLLVASMFVSSKWGNVANEVVVDIGLGILTAGISGGLLNYARQLSLQFYWIAHARPRSIRPNYKVRVRPPSPVVRYLLSPRGWDVPLALICGVAVCLIFLHLNP